MRYSTNSSVCSSTPTKAVIVPVVLMLLWRSKGQGAHGEGRRAGGRVHLHGTGRQHKTQGREEKSKIGAKRSWGHQGQGGRSSKIMGASVNEWENWKLVRKERKEGSWKTAALWNVAFFMHCTVGLSGEKPLLDRVRAPGTNWEALNYPSQSREAMR